VDLGHGGDHLLASLFGKAVGAVEPGVEPGGRDFEDVAQPGDGPEVPIAGDEGERQVEWLAK
jgi:hypothetical protein